MGGGEGAFIVQGPQDRRGVKARKWEKNSQQGRQFTHEFEFGGFITLEDLGACWCSCLHFQHPSLPWVISSFLNTQLFN